MPSANSPSAPGEVEIYALATRGAHQPIHLAREEAIEVAIEPETLRPDDVELAVVGLDHLVEQHSDHETHGSCRHHDPMNHLWMTESPMSGIPSSISRRTQSMQLPRLL